MPKGWNNSGQHREIVKLLAVILAGFPDFQPTLCFGAAPLHLAPEVRKELESGSLQWLLVPARLTVLFQPLDTNVSMKFKMYLKQRFVEAVLHGAPNENKTARMVRLVILAIRYVLQAHEWETTFKQTGIWSGQPMMSDSIPRRLQYEQAPAIDSTHPVPEMLQKLLPRNHAFHTDIVISLLPGSGSRLKWQGDNFHIDPIFVHHCRTVITHVLWNSSGTPKATFQDQCILTAFS